MASLYTEPPIGRRLSIDAMHLSRTRANIYALTL